MIHVQYLQNLSSFLSTEPPLSADYIAPYCYRERKRRVEQRSVIFDIGWEQTQLGALKPFTSGGSAVQAQESTGQNKISNVSYENDEQSVGSHQFPTHNVSQSPMKHPECIWFCWSKVETLSKTGSYFPKAKSFQPNPILIFVVCAPWDKFLP